MGRYASFLQRCRRRGKLKLAACYPGSARVRLANSVQRVPVEMHPAREQDGVAFSTAGLPYGCSWASRRMDAGRRQRTE